MMPSFAGPSDDLSELRQMLEQSQQMNQSLMEQMDEMRRQMESMRKAMVPSAQGSSDPSGLPRTIKLEKPATFDGKCDGDTVRAFFFSLEQFFLLSGLSDPLACARYLSTLLTGPAAIWLQSQRFDWTYTDYDTVKQRMLTYFTPTESLYAARTKLAQMKQTGAVTGYINAIRQVALRISDLSDSELLDRFLRGLRPQVFERVIMHNPTSFEQAAQLAERTSLSLSFVAQQGRGQVPSQPRDTRPFVPMELGGQRGQPMRMNTPQAQYRPRSPRQGRQPMMGQGMRPPQQQGGVRTGPGARFQGNCNYCGKFGHMARDCWAKGRTQQGHGQRPAFNFMNAPAGSMMQTATSVQHAQPPLPPPPRQEPTLSFETGNPFRSLN